VMELEQYQPEWCKGREVSTGVRDCAGRYAAVRQIAERFSRPFTVLDLGANLGYFSMRLAEEFDCTVVAVEDMYGAWLGRLLEANGNPRVIHLKRAMTLDDLRALAGVEHFDMTLALSVMHHIDGGYENVLAALRGMGGMLVAEIATERAAAYAGNVRQGYVPADAAVIGEFDSHLGGVRPMFAVWDHKRRLERAYLGTPLDDVEVVIDSDWDTKRKYQHGQWTDWARGINLRTYLDMGGVWPSRADILRMVEAARPAEPHGDLRAHNTILQGDGVVFVDANDPRRLVLDDDEMFREMVEELKSPG
jgi:hypothetical protein